MNYVIKGLIIGFVVYWFVGMMTGAVDSEVMRIITYICGIAAFIIYLIIHAYNELINARNEVSNSWAQIDVQLNRRMDLIPNIVETVKGYASHENETLTNVIEARSGLKSADTVQGTVNANNKLNEALAHMFMVVESYPDLKADANFQDLQNQLRQTENLISNYREIFNNKVLEYNNLCEQIPSNIVAILFNFKTAEFFETEEEYRSAPKVQF